MNGNKKEFREILKNTYRRQAPIIRRSLVNAGKVAVTLTVFVVVISAVGIISKYLSVPFPTVKTAILKEFSFVTLVLISFVWILFVLYNLFSTVLLILGHFIEIIISGLVTKFDYALWLESKLYEESIESKKSKYDMKLLTVTHWFTILIIIISIPVSVVFFFSDYPKDDLLFGFLDIFLTLIPLIVTAGVSITSIYYFYVRYRKLHETNFSDEGTFYLFGNHRISASSISMLFKTVWLPLYCYSGFIALYTCGRFLAFSSDFFPTFLDSFPLLPQNRELDMALVTHYKNVVSSAISVFFDRANSLNIPYRLYDSLLKSFQYLLPILVIVNVVAPLVLVYKRKSFMLFFIPSVFGVILAQLVIIYLNRVLGSNSIYLIIIFSLLAGIVLRTVFYRNKEVINSKDLALILGVKPDKRFYKVLRKTATLPFIRQKSEMRFNEKVIKDYLLRNPDLLKELGVKDNKSEMNLDSKSTKRWPSK